MQLANLCTAAMPKPTCVCVFVCGLLPVTCTFKDKNDSKLDVRAWLARAIVDKS